MAKYFVAVLCLLVASQVEAQRRAVAMFNARGVSGYIRFTEVTEGVSIEVNLQGLRGNHAWHVHELPVDQTVDPLMQCLGPNVGPHYDPFNENDGDDYEARCAADSARCEAGDLRGKFGFLMPDTPVTEVDSTGTLFLRDQYSIIGRSIVIHSPGDGVNFECTTIRSVTELSEDAEVTLLQASFINPLAGTVYFRQVEGEDVQMWGKFYWIGDQPTTEQHNWHIHSVAPGEEYRRGDCSVIEGHFRPFGNGPPSIEGYDQVCGRNMTGGCEVGDLTGKHDSVTVADSPYPYSTNAFFYTDNFLNLTGENAVLNRSVAVHNPNGGADVEGDPVIACAPLIRSENIVLTQYMLREITMSQASPFEDTVITSTEAEEERTSTTIQDFAFNQLIQNCPESQSSLFAPYDPVEVEEPGVETPDRFVLGQLQDRYTEISGATTQRVFDFPIYGGSISITSLTLRSESSCSALVPPLMGANTIVAKVSFSRVTSGAVYLIQENFGFDQLGNTHIIVDVYYADEEMSPTMGHNWHVHQLPSPDGEACVQDGVAIVGPHYNPFNVSLSSPGSNSDYATDCSPRYQLRCESGDLTGKHGQLDIYPDGPDRPTYTYVDSNVQLTGNSSIIGRSIALHDISTGLPIFDCGTVNQVFVSSTRVTVTTAASSMSRNSMTTILANEIENVEPTDILVLNQEVFTMFEITCVEVSMRVLGPSQGAADTYASSLNDMAGELFRCGALRTVSVSQVAAVLPLLMAAFYFLMLAKH